MCVCVLCVCVCVVCVCMPVYVCARACVREVHIYICCSTNIPRSVFKKRCCLIYQKRQNPIVLSAKRACEFRISSAPLLIPEMPWSSCASFQHLQRTERFTHTSGITSDRRSTSGLVCLSTIATSQQTAQQERFQNHGSCQSH